MIVSIGMLARNEAARIAQTLRSLLQQSVFRADGNSPAAQWELIVVPNGCTDATAEAARAALAQLLPARNVTASVASSQAWVWLG